MLRHDPTHHRPDEGRESLIDGRLLLLLLAVLAAAFAIAWTME